MVKSWIFGFVYYLSMSIVGNGHFTTNMDSDDSSIFVKDKHAALVKFICGTQFGCLFDDSLCKLPRRCIDDGLLGSCLSVVSRQEESGDMSSSSWLHMDDSVLKQISEVVKHGGNMNWRASGSQSLIHSLLFRLFLGDITQSDFCSKYPYPSMDHPDVVDPTKSRATRRWDRTNKSKRDEIVEIHKYLSPFLSTFNSDKTKEQHTGQDRYGRDEATLQSTSGSDEHTMTKRQLLKDQLSSLFSDERLRTLPVEQHRGLSYLASLKEAKSGRSSANTPIEHSPGYFRDSGESRSLSSAEKKISNKDVRRLYAVIQLLQDRQKNYEMTSESMDSLLTKKRESLNDPRPKLSLLQIASRSGATSHNPLEDEGGKFRHHAGVDKDANDSTKMMPETLGRNDLRPIENQKNYAQVDTRSMYIVAKDSFKEKVATDLLTALLYSCRISRSDIEEVKFQGKTLTIKINSKSGEAGRIAFCADNHRNALERKSNVKIVETGVGTEMHLASDITDRRRQNKIIVIMLLSVVCGILISVAAVLFVKRRSELSHWIHRFSRHGKNAHKNVACSYGSTAEQYENLCREHANSSPHHKIDASLDTKQKCPLPLIEHDPEATKLDVNTGHIVLKYMETHLLNKELLEREWADLENYQPELTGCLVALDPANWAKNRYMDCMPYDHSRVKLSDDPADLKSYINASLITDHDPRTPAYIATQGPLQSTVCDFWKMIWNHDCTVIVSLTRLVEGGIAMCHRYWPEDSSQIYGDIEVHLVSEHSWCEDYVVRSVFLRNLTTGLTRTITQFHYLAWPSCSLPTNVCTFLDFRRKVNRSYRGSSRIIVVQCNDGCGRSGAYILLDMALNRLLRTKSGITKEMNLAATVEHLRDQRMKLVRTKEQFEFALTAVCNEVQTVLKTVTGPPANQ